MVWYAVSVGGRHAGYCRSDLITPHVKDYYVEWETIFYKGIMPSERI